MAYDNIHHFYHPNSAFRSSILAGITLFHFHTAQESLLLIYNLALWPQKNWLKHSVSAMFILLLLRYQNYTICR